MKPCMNFWMCVSACVCVCFMQCICVCEQHQDKETQCLSWSKGDVNTTSVDMKTQFKGYGANLQNDLGILDKWNLSLWFKPIKPLEHRREQVTEQYGGKVQKVKMRDGNRSQVISAPCVNGDMPRPYHHPVNCLQCLNDNPQQRRQQCTPMLFSCESVCESSVVCSPTKDNMAA